MKLRITYLLISLMTLFLSVNNAYALSYPKNTIGQDVSWPNCNNLKFTPAVFGIVGVNGGLSFHANPCISQESVLYRQNLSLYVNTGFPGYPRDQLFINSPLECTSTDLPCLSYNYGYNAGKFATNYALTRGIVSNNWWLDVETVNSWTNDPYVNYMSLVGESDAITESVKPTLIGYYTYPPEWKILTNGWQNKLPNWVASNSNFKNVAAKQCSGYNFTGGQTLLTQYIGNVDLDIAC